IGFDLDAGEPLLDAAQADEPRRLKDARLHHQHERGAAGDGTHRRIVGIEQRDGLGERARLDEVERNHVACPPDAGANAACRRLANSFSICLALARSTGWPMLPSLPASVDSLSYCTLVSSPDSTRRVSERAVSRPTTPSGTPSTLASI